MQKSSIPKSSARPFIAVLKISRSPSRPLVHSGVSDGGKSETFTQLSSQTRAALDALVKRQMPENDGDAEQRTLFPIRSDLAVIKEGAGALKVETVLDEIAKLEQLRALGLPEDLFWDVPAKLSAARWY
jgi:hypothetical protein